MTLTVSHSHSSPCLPLSSAPFSFPVQLRSPLICHQRIFITQVAGKSPPLRVKGCSALLSPPWPSSHHALSPANPAHQSTALWIPIVLCLLSRFLILGCLHPSDPPLPLLPLPQVLLTASLSPPILFSSPSQDLPAPGVPNQTLGNVCLLSFDFYTDTAWIW